MSHIMCTNTNERKNKALPMPRKDSTSKLEKAVDGLSAAQLRQRARRTESIKVRLTPDLKDGIQEAADRLGLSVSELIVQVVEHALPKLQERRA